MAKTPRKPPGSAESMLPPGAPLPTELHLLPKSMYAAAERLKHGSLQGEIVERQYPVDYAPLLRLLETLNESGEPAALTELADRLSGHPMLLGHPLVWDLFRALYSFASPHEAYNTYADEWLIKLVKAWAEGITSGYDVVITRPSAGRGQSQQLFPHLREMDGWWPSTEADEDYSDAVVFRWAYDDLLARLKPCRRWRRDLRDHRDMHKQERDTTALLEEIAEDVDRVFQDFKQAWTISTPPLAPTTLQRIVQKVLAGRKGRNPLHELTCALLATFRWVNRHGEPLKLTPSLVDSTLDTLRKRGITWKEEHALRVLPLHPQPKRVFFSGGRACVHPFFA
jgi:hypothetical protein